VSYCAEWSANRSEPSVGSEVVEEQKQIFDSPTPKLKSAWPRSLRMTALILLELTTQTLVLSTRASLFKECSCLRPCPVPQRAAETLGLSQQSKVEREVDTLIHT